MTPVPDQEAPDLELVSRAQRGDANSFAALVARHQQIIWRLALRMLGSEAEAQEVAQEAFLHAWEKLPEFRGEAQFSSWLYRIAANGALMRLRRRSRSPEEAAADLPGPRFESSGEMADPPGLDWSTQADELLASRELGGAIDEAVRALPEDYRVVFLLKDVDGLSNEAIAQALSLTVAAVKSRLHRARLALRERLGSFFLERGGGMGSSGPRASPRQDHP